MIRLLAKSSFYAIQRRVARMRSRRTSRSPAEKVVVFCLHTIGEPHNDMAISAPRFRAQMEGLLNAGYRALDIDSLLEVLGGKRLPHPAFAVTFDDGYESVLTTALPILDSLEIPAAVFLTTGFLDGEVAPPWGSSDVKRLQLYRSGGATFRPLSWEQAGELSRHRLIRMGSHSVSHPLLAKLPPDAIRKELADSRSRIAERLGLEIDLFAYPFGVGRYGAYSAVTEALLRESGYRCSLTSEISSAPVAGGPWMVPRMSLTEEDEPSDAVAKAAGAYDWVGWAQRAYQSVFSNPHEAH
jgi:peptidoglycan/xylan/chitin deacetylase (PgdA/CDA1 family)